MRGFVGSVDFILNVIGSYWRVLKEMIWFDLYFIR